MEVDSNLSPDQQALYRLLVNANKQQTLELKKEIQQVLHTNEILHKEVDALRTRCLTLERASRKNNIIIFGLKNTDLSKDLLTHILEQVNLIFEGNFTLGDINNYYPIGKEKSGSRPVVVQFVSFLKKRKIFQDRNKLKNLKAHGLSIANDLCPEDRKVQRTLYKHLQIARSQKLDAKIVGHKLVIDNQEYQVENLEKLERDTEPDFASSGIHAESTEEVETIADKIHVTRTIAGADPPETTTGLKPMVEKDSGGNQRSKSRTKHKYSPKNTRNSKK